MAKPNAKTPKRRKWPWVVGGLAGAMPVGVVALFLLDPWLVFWAVALLVPSIWQSVDVPLPDGVGEITLLFSSSHPFLTEYDRQIDIRLADGRRLRSPIMGNTGGRTFLMLFWQPEWWGKGSFLLLEDRHGQTWVNIADLCLDDSRNPSYAISSKDRCHYATLPTSKDWTYFGRVDATDGNRRFIPGDQWPPVDADISWQLWPPVVLPDDQWSFAAIRRDPPSRHISHLMDHWLTVRGPNGIRLKTWFRADTFGDDLASVYWYPEEQGDGPYLRIGRTKGALIDIRRRRTYRVYYSRDRYKSEKSIIPKVFAIQPDEEVMDTMVHFDSASEFFHAVRRDGSTVVLDPLPDLVAQGRGRYLGDIDIDEMTFTR